MNRYQAQGKVVKVLKTHFDKQIEHIYDFSTIMEANDCIKGLEWLSYQALEYIGDIERGDISTEEVPDAFKLLFPEIYLGKAKLTKVKGSQKHLHHIADAIMRALKWTSLNGMRSAVSELMVHFNRYEKEEKNDK